MPQSYKLLITRDGSRTLYSQQSQQSFHSMHGALTESIHVFLEGAKISELFQSTSKVAILEIGFGTGLNWLLTTSLALDYRVEVAYTAIDQEIPPADLFNELDYGNLIGIPSVAALLTRWRQTFGSHVPPGSYHVPIKDESSLNLLIGNATNIIPDSPNLFDRIYLDAFDPKVNPDLWSPEFIQRLYDCLQDGGGLATYSAAGHVRRTLEASGFTVIRRPGPPGKREVLSAWKPKLKDP